MQKVNVVLDEQQQTELQMILMDQDEKAALLYLKESSGSKSRHPTAKRCEGTLKRALRINFCPPPAF
jgi:hypothetical protein